MIRVGYHELVGEIIRLEGDMATIQVDRGLWFWDQGMIFNNRCMRRRQELQLVTLSSELANPSQ